MNLTNKHLHVSVPSMIDFSALAAKFEKYQFAPDPVYACRQCRDSGIISELDNFGNERWRRCECAIRNRQELILRKAGFDVDASPELADYEPWCETAKVAKKQAGEFIKNFDAVSKTGKNWFLIYGQSGSGKTMLGRAIVKSLVKRRKPVCAVAVKFYEIMYKLKSNANDGAYVRFLDDYRNCELLFIDDLLKEKAKGGELTEADVKHLFAVIDSRYENRLPTIITTECTMGRIAELDEAVYWRMSERAFAEIVFTGTENNYRKRI